MKPITFVGFYGKKNSGDDAFTLALPKLFPGRECKFVHGPPKDAGSTIILGAGEVLNKYFMDFIPDRTPFYALGVGFPYDGDLDFVRHPTKYLQAVVTRTRADVPRLQHSGASYAPDPVFILDVPTTPKTLQGPKKFLGVMLTDSLNLKSNPKVKKYGEYLRMELAETLTYLQEWFDLVFIAMSESVSDNDMRSLLMLSSHMPDSSGIKFVPYEKDPMKTIELVRDLDLLLTMRFHGCIYATLTGTPFVNYGLSKKTQLYCAEQGLSGCTVPSYSFTKDRCLAAVKNAEQDGVRDNLLDIATENKARLGELQRLVAQWE